MVVLGLFFVGGDFVWCGVVGLGDVFWLLGICDVVGVFVYGCGEVLVCGLFW